MKTLILAFLLGAPAWGANFTCTATGAGNLSNPAIWSSCNSTYPHNNGSDQYRVVTGNNAIAFDVSTTLGHGGAPLNGYITLTTVSAGSGYTNSCSGLSLSGGTAIRTPTLYVGLIQNGRCIYYLSDYGGYSAGTPSLSGSVTSSDASLTNASTIKGVTTTLQFSPSNNCTGGSPWNVGSSQSITLSGATGTGWTGLNASWTATVTSADNCAIKFTIPIDSSGFSGNPGGTVSIAPGTAASYSLNYIAGGGGAAVLVGLTGKVTLNASTVTTLNEDMSCTSGGTAACLQVNGGSAGSPTKLVFDSTADSGSMLSLAGSGETIERQITSSGCAAANIGTDLGTCIIQGISGTPARIDGSYSREFHMNVDAVTFRYLGDSMQPAIYGTPYPSSASTVYTIKNSLFDACGRMYYAGGANTTIVTTFDHNAFINSPISGRGFPLNLEYNVSSSGTITRSIQFNSFDGAYATANRAGSNTSGSTTIQGNWFGYRFEPSGTAVNVWASMSNNFLHLKFPDGAQAAGFSLPGSMSQAYLFLDSDTLSNPHTISAVPASSTITLDGIVGGFSGRMSGDEGEWTTGNSATAVTVQNSVFLCSAEGISPAEIASTFGNVTGAGGTFTFDHNTFCGGYGTFGPVQINETGTTTTGSVTMKNNLIYALASSSSVKIDDTGNTVTITGASTTKGNPTTLVSSTNFWSVAGTQTIIISGATGTGWTGLNGTWTATYVSNPTGSTTSFTVPLDSSGFTGTPGGTITFKTLDACSPLSACDYNGSYNLNVSSNKGYAGQWSGTPGTHDVDSQNPDFLARTRKVENFDTGYLGKPLSTAWSGGGTYAYGDIVSNTNASMYSNEALNYRCIQLTGCTGLAAPGVPGTAWRTNWEFAALYWVRLANYAKTQYTDSTISCSGCYVVQALTNWVIAGHAPQASAFRGTGSAGSDIGAVTALISNGVRNALFFSIP